MSVAEIQSAILNLSQQEQGNLAAWLLDELPPHSSEDAAGETVEEAARRREELDSGKKLVLSSEEFWDSIQRERARWR